MLSAEPVVGLSLTKPSVECSTDRAPGAPRLSFLERSPCCPAHDPALSLTLPTSPRCRSVPLCCLALSFMGFGGVVSAGKGGA